MYHTAESLAKRGLKSQEKGEWETAIDYYQKALKQKPIWPIIYLNKGLAHDQLNDIRGAICNYQKALEQNPNLIKAYYHLGIAYQKNGQISAAINLYQKAIEIAKSFPSEADKHYLIDIYSHLGYLLISRRHLKAAILVLREGINSFKREAILLNNLGQCLLEAHLYKKAVFCFKMAIKLEPDNSIFYQNLGQSFQRLNLHRDAIASYKRAIELQPESILAQSSLGEIFISVGEFKSAIACFKAAISSQKIFIDYYCSRARALTGKDELEKAIITCGQFLESLNLDDNFSEAVTYLNQIYIQLGKLLILSRHYGKAEPFYKKSLQINPRSLETYQQLKLCLEKQGKWNAGEVIQQFIDAVYWEKSKQNYLDIASENQRDIKLKLADDLDRNNLQTCEGLNCQTCLRKIAKNFEIKPRKDKIYSLAFKKDILIEQPEVKVDEFQQGRVWVAPQKNHWLVCDQIAIWDNQNQLIPELSRSYPGQLPFCELEQTHQKQNFNPQDFQPEGQYKLESIPGTIALLSGLSANVYFHWMVDILPRFDILQKGGYSWDQIDGFIVNSIQHPFQRETLEKLGVPLTKIIESDCFPYLQAEKLIVPSFPSYLGWLSTEALTFNRSLFLNSKTQNQPDSPTRIYISRERANYRRIINETEVTSWLSQWGFVRVELESLSVEEQVTLFANAEIILSPHGSGLTNLMFCSPGTTVIELVSPHYIRHYFWVISQQLKLQHYYLKGEEFSCYPVRQLMYPNPLTEDILISLKSLENVMKIAGITQHPSRLSLKPGTSDSAMYSHQNNIPPNSPLIPAKPTLKTPMASPQSGLPLNSEDTDIYLYGAEAFYNENKYEQAAEICRRILVVKPHAKAYKILGNIRQSQGQLEEAKDCYAKAIQLRPDFAEVFCNLGTLYAQQQEWQPAVICYQKAINLQPKFTIAYRNLARIWNRLGKKQEAAECWYQAYTLNPESISSKDFLQLGNTLLDVGLLERAISSYCQAIQSNPYSIESYKNLGKAMKRQIQLSQDILDDKNTVPLLSSQPEVLSANSIEKILSESQLKPDQSLVPIPPQQNIPSPSKKSQVESYIKQAETEAQLGHLSAATQACQQVLKLQPDTAIAYKILGQIEQAQGHRESAQKLYKKAIELGWKDAEIYLNLGTLCAQSQQWKEAVEYYHQSLKNNPKSVVVYHNLSKVWKQLNKPVESANCLYEAYSLDPQRATAKEHFDLGNTLLKQNQITSAIACYKRVVEMDSNLTAAYENLSEALKRQGKVAEAEFYLQKLQQVDHKTLSEPQEYKPENNIQNLLNEGNGHQNSESVEVASVSSVPQQNLNGKLGLNSKFDEIQLSEDSTKVESSAAENRSKQFKEAENYLNQAEDCLKERQFKKVIYCCQKAIESKPDVAMAYKLWGNALQALGQLEEAKQQYNQALSLDPNIAEVHANLGSLSAKNQEWELAISYYQKAISLKPNLASAYRNLAKIWKRLGKTQEWAKCWYQVFSLEPETFTAEDLAKLAQSMLKLGKLDWAISCYQQLIKLDQSHIEAYRNLGEIYIRKQKWPEAIAIYYQAVKYHPQNPNFYCRLGQVLAHLQRWEEAITAYKKALDLNPKLGLVYQHLGEIWIAQAQFDQAIRCYRQLIELEPKNGEAYHRLGDILQENGQLDEAIEVYRQATELTEIEAVLVEKIEVEA
ncbi:tetratricopeptide repeat protein [Capilliphycus salinus ALCB114379]|uniref:tetratricopeptide repeat protein n=1 Tax=Capilliphycus salinus TaxID=2768948 RepID=UPI0039A58BC4